MDNLKFIECPNFLNIQDFLLNIQDQHIIVEEKMDGSRVAIFFNEIAELKIYHKNQPVKGPEFDSLIKWCEDQQDNLFDRLGDQYVMFGEWMFVTHTIFYDSLPAYFLESDILDKSKNIFLSTLARKNFLYGMGIQSISVLEEGRYFQMQEFEELASMSSMFITLDQQEKAIEMYNKQGWSRGDALSMMDLSGHRAGINIRAETDNEVVGRYFLTNEKFRNTELFAEQWSRKPVIQNLIEK